MSSMQRETVPMNASDQLPSLMQQLIARSKRNRLARVIFFADLFESETKNCPQLAQLAPLLAQLCADEIEIRCAGENLLKQIKLLDHPHISVAVACSSSNELQQLMRHPRFLATCREIHLDFEQESFSWDRPRVRSSGSLRIEAWPRLEAVTCLRCDRCSVEIHSSTPLRSLTFACPLALVPPALHYTVGNHPSLVALVPRDATSLTVPEHEMDLDAFPRLQQLTMRASLNSAPPLIRSTRQRLLTHCSLGDESIRCHGSCVIQPGQQPLQTASIIEMHGRFFTRDLPTPSSSHARHLRIGGHFRSVEQWIELIRSLPSLRVLEIISIGAEAENSRNLAQLLCGIRDFASHLELIIGAGPSFLDWGDLFCFADPEQCRMFGTDQHPHIRTTVREALECAESQFLNQLLDPNRSAPLFDNGPLSKYEFAQHERLMAQLMGL